MAETWLVRTGFTSQDLRDHPTRTYLFHGALGIMNRSTSRIDVRAVYLLPNSQGLAAGLGNHALYRITGVSGGTSLAAMKRDASAADLPPQVLIREQPDSLTMTEKLRTAGDSPGYSLQGGGLAAFPQLHPHRRMRAAEFFEAGMDTAVQRVALREGQGVALVQESGSVAHVQLGVVTIRNQATGATYDVLSKNLDARREGDAPLLAIVNGTGSGVILEVVLAEFIDYGCFDFASGTAFTLLPGLRVIPTEVIFGGEALTPVPLDTNDAPLPAGVEILRNPKVAVGRGVPDIGVVFRAFEAGGATFEFTNFQKVGNLRGSLIEPFWTSAPLKNWRHCRLLCYARYEHMGMTLRQGTGLAVVHMWHPRFDLALGRDEVAMRTFENFDVAMEFTHTPAASDAGPFQPLETPHVVIA